MVWSFRDVVVNPETRELLRAGRPQGVSGRGFGVLVYLIAHRDRVVGRHELLDQCWPGVTVSDGSLTTCIKELRRALGDTGQEHRSLRTVHGLGYQFVARLREESARPVSSQGVAHSTGLLGRGPALQQLDEALRAACEGRGSLLRLTGPPGIGKTATAELAARKQEGTGMLVLRGAASDVHGAPSLWLWVQLLRNALARLPTEVLRDALGNQAAELIELVPEFSGLVPETKVRVAMAPAEQGFRLMDALVQTLLRLSAQRPLCLVLDDLHWADPTSLQVLEMLGRHVADAALCVLTLHRPPPVGSPLRATSAELGRTGGAQEVPLQPLDDQDARALVSQAGAANLPAEVVDAIVGRGQGLPLYLLELARLGADSAAELPEGLLQLMERRLSSLPQGAASVVRAAAVIGRRVEAEVVASVCEQSEAEVWNALAAAEAEGLLSVRPAFPDRHFFSHALTRDMIYALTPKAMRSELHRRTARHIEASFGREPHVMRALSYHHGESGNVERAASAVVDSVAGACSLGAHRTARQLAERALTTHADHLDSVDRTRMILEHGRALVAAGAPFERVQRLYDEIHDTDVAELAPEVFAEAVLEATGYGVFSATSRVRGLAMPAELEAVEDALRRLPQRSMWRPLVSIWLANLLQRSTRSHEAQSLAEQALRAAMGLGEPRITCAVLIGRAALLTEPGALRQRSAVAAQALKLADQLDQAFLRVEARAQQMAARLGLGEDCEQEARSIEALAEASGHAGLALPALHFRLGRSLAQLQLETAREMGQRAFELTHRRNPTTAALTAALVDFAEAQITGEVQTLRSCLEVSMRDDPDNASLQASLMSARTLGGALTDVAPMLDVLVRDLPRWHSHVDGAAILSACARAAAALGGTPHLETLREACAAQDDAWLTHGDTVVWIGPGAYDSALLADCAHDFAEADRLFRQAEQLCERMNATGPLLRVQARWAGSRLRRRGARTRDVLTTLQTLRGRVRGLPYVSLARELDAMLAPDLVGASASAWRSKH